MKLTGQCHCGAVAYEMDDDKMERTDCDCRECQRATGGLVAPFVSVGCGNFRLTKGAGVEFKAESGEACDKYGRWLFCDKCGTMLLWKSDTEGFLTVMAGTINEVDEVARIPIPA